MPTQRKSTKNGTRPAAAPNAAVIDDEPEVGGARRIIDDFDDYTDELSERAARRRRQLSSRSDRMREESQSMLRAFTIAYLKQVELVGDLTSNFANSLLEGSISEESGTRRAREGEDGAPRRERPWDGLPDFADDVADGIIDAFDEVVQIPRRMFDDAYDTYDRTRVVPRQNGNGNGSGRARKDAGE
jgi:hypothetical protein